METNMNMNTEKKTSCEACTSCNGSGNCKGCEKIGKSDAPRDNGKGYVEFTSEMKKEYKILVPNMLPTHFKLIMRVMKNEGYDMELLENAGKDIAEKGLKYTHNDTCYPAVIVIGQFIDALESGKYDPDKTALIMFQTGGGCRASNYISLIRKALAKAGYGHVPVISFSFAGIEKHSGWRITPAVLYKLFYAVFYADLLMSLENHCEAYEKHPGDTKALSEKWLTYLTRPENGKSLTNYRTVKENYRRILSDFALLPMTEEKKVKVGIVGEIFVKYSPLANNRLRDFLIENGAEPVIPGLIDFCLYSIFDTIYDRKLYGIRSAAYPLFRLAYSLVLKKQKDLIRIMEEDGHFEPPTPFSVTRSLAEDYIGLGTKMGEGWLLTAEMLELYTGGTKNIVCAQPFGCLPNHICGKGMMKPIKERNPDANIVAVDYDAGASAVNQENRIRLMLAFAGSPR